MNPFEATINKTVVVASTCKIWIDMVGKHKNTCISNLTMFDETVLKEHLKKLKKKHGCSGMIKEHVLMLQGDHINNMIDYFKELNITNIVVNKV